MIIAITQRRKRRLREVKELTQGHTLSSGLGIVHRVSSYTSHILRHDALLPLPL